LFSFCRLESYRNLNCSRGVSPMDLATIQPNRGGTRMRCHWLLLAGLLVLSGGGVASAQQEEVAEPLATQAASPPAASQPATAAKLVELEFWVVHLSAATNPQQWDAAQADVASREEVAKRVGQLRQEKLVARSRYYRAVVLEGHEFTSQQGIREPRVQSVNKT